MVLLFAGTCTTIPTDGFAPALGTLVSDNFADHDCTIPYQLPFNHYLLLKEGSSNRQMTEGGNMGASATRSGATTANRTVRSGHSPVTCVSTVAHWGCRQRHKSRDPRQSATLRRRPERIASTYREAVKLSIHQGYKDCIRHCQDKAQRGIATQCTVVSRWHLGGRAFAR